MDQILAFDVQPRRAPVNAAIDPPPEIAIRNRSGETNTSATTAVTVTLAGGPPGAIMSGPRVVNAVSGVATFGQLKIDRSGWYWLAASAAGAMGAVSDSFRIFPPYQTLTAGAGHSCGSTASGIAYCWGRSLQGQLGIGTTTPNWGIPKEVSLPPGVGFTAMAAGGFHTCALTSAGATYCWGDNTFHQVGDGTSEMRASPVRVNLPGGASLASVSAGYWHSCGVTGTGAAYCWGLNVDGALGDASTTTPSAPVAVAAPAGVTFAWVSAGGGQTCGVTQDGRAFCWGENPYGGLGDGTTTARTTPVAVTAPGGVSFSIVSAGDEHSCALTPSGAAYCWGRNDVGQLGDGTTTHRLIPVPVAAPAGVSFATIEAGHFRTCATAAAPTVGAIYCWGLNDLVGLLGDGTTINRPTPTLVASPPGAIFTRVDVALEHSCALTPLGVAYCWGAYGFGQLGSEGGASMTPVAVLQ